MADVSETLVLKCGADEGGEEWVRFEGLGLELGIESAAEKPRMFGCFDDLDVSARRECGR